MFDIQYKSIKIQQEKTIIAYYHSIKEQNHPQNISQNALNFLFQVIGSLFQQNFNIFHSGSYFLPYFVSPSSQLPIDSGIFLANLFSFNNPLLSQQRPFYKILLSIFMPQRKPWSNEEDALLKQLREEEKISKWSLIAKKMTEEYHLPGRTGKQCRERYHNHLDVMISRSQWSPEEQQYLYRLHDEIGNKWAIIAQKLPGRTDNCVKNHFYSKMRKAIRKLNKVIHMHFKKEIKEIRLNVLYKLVEATDEKFKLNPVIDEEISDRCCQLKNQLLEYANEEDQEEQIHDIDKLQQLARNIHEVSSRYRKRPKRSRRNSAHGPEIIPLGKFSPKYRSANSDNEFSSDEEDESNENPDSFSIKGVLGLASVKQEEQLKDGAFTVPSFIEQDNYEMKFEEGPIEFDENLYRENQNNNEEQSFNPNYMMEIQNNLSTPRIENLLGEQIQRLDLNGGYYLNDLDMEDCDDRLI